MLRKFLCDTKQYESIYIIMIRPQGQGIQQTQLCQTRTHRLGTEKWDYKTTSFKEKLWKEELKTNSETKTKSSQGQKVKKSDQIENPHQKN